MTCRVYAVAAFLTVAACVAVAPHRAASQNLRRTALKVSVSQGCCETTDVYLPESVDVAPSFPGGDAAMMRYINAQRRYPAAAYAAELQGRVVCGFVVAADGTIGQVDVIRGVERSLDAEAVRLIRSMPQWEPGELAGRKVAVYCIVPVPFRR